MQAKQMRKCISCRESFNQADLLRICKIKDSMIIDEKQKAGGRGAYICKNKQCLQLAIKKKALNRAFKTNLDNEIYIQLGEYEQNN